MTSINFRNFGRLGDAIEIPDLVEVQLKSYDRFLQKDTPFDKRTNTGLEALFREIFPITSYDKSMELEYQGYELEAPRYTIEQCRQLRLTYGYPMKVHCRLKRKDKEDMAAQGIYLGEIPIMIGGGEFIINGAERVIVTQLHRSPGVDFVIDSKDGDRLLHGARIIPERGSWIEMSVTKKDVLVIRIDQSNKIPATTFLRAMSPDFGKTASLLRLFYPTQTVKTKKLEPTMWAVGPIVDTESGEILVEAGAQLGDMVGKIQASGLDSVEVVSAVADGLILNTISEDKCEGHEEALMKIYARLRPGNPANLEKAKQLFDEKFYDPNRYRLGAVGRFRLRRKFGASVSDAKDDKTSDNKIPGHGLSKQEIRDQIVGKRAVNSPCAKWLSKNFEKLREDYYVDKGKIRTGGLAFKFFVTEKDGNILGKEELEALESKLAHEFPFSKSQNWPRFNQESGLMALSEVEKIWENNPNLDKFFEECKKLINTPESWIKVISLEEHKNLPNDQGIYFFKSLKTGQIGDGYVGIAGKKRGENIDGQGLQKRLGHHFRDSFDAAKPENCGDSLLKSFAVEELYELNNKSGHNEPELVTEMSLKPEDFLNTIKYILGLRSNVGDLDDIDHLGNRRLRTIDELGASEVRKGLLKLRRTVQERMSSKTIDEVARVADLVNSKSVSSSIEFFFGRGELSQVVDQTNALSQLTHERRLSALGPGGLNRKRAGFEVRDVHISHYGRVCPIETPEGSNIGLIVSLATFSKVDEYGFLVTPYRKVKNKKVTEDIQYLRADQEMRAVFTPPSMVNPANHTLYDGMVLARQNGELTQVDSTEVEFVDISPKQMVGISAALIPFLEHDDANRALMGSNMQRQSVPLLVTEVPLVGTGIERQVARDSSMSIKAKNAGAVTAVDANMIVVNNTDEYPLLKYQGLNERTCLNQRPIVSLGQKVKKGQTIADGGGTCGEHLALGRNILAAFVPFDGFNFEDAILISERLVKDDVFTSIHIDEFSVEVRETKLGREEFTRDIPNVSEKALRNLDENGVVREGTRVAPGDILVGKVSPKSKTELTPEEKLLHAIFGRAGEDVKNDSLEVPSGYEGVVIKARRFMRKGAGTDDQRKAQKEQIKRVEAETKVRECSLFKDMMAAIHTGLNIDVVDPSSKQKAGVSDDIDVITEQIESFDITWIKPASMRDEAKKIVDQFWPRLKNVQDERARELERMKHGDELPTGVLEMVKIYIATKRTLSVGDKMAGRHGNKGVIAKIMPVEDMPFLEDGTSVDICLNPLGVPSRMNVGQILETHLGWAAKVLGFHAITPVFDGATEEDIHNVIKEANQHVVNRTKTLEDKKEVPPANEIFAQLPEHLKVRLYDGRTGEPFDQNVTVGYMYIMKLHHLVDDKIHARSTGPYSLITQQPLGGKARTGGQRFGEMEVWALEAYGAAYTLQELLTVKSDDIEGRTKIYESMVKGTNTLEAGTPISFDVLCNEIRGLGLNIQLEKKRVGMPQL